LLQIGQHVLARAQLLSSQSFGGHSGQAEIYSGRVA